MTTIQSERLAPTGAQIEIAAAGQRAVIVEVGGGLRFYSASGRELLDGYRIDDMCPSGRGQVLIPWPNRLQDGTYEFEGKLHHLPLNESDKQIALHGLVRWAGWKVSEHQSNRVVMEHVLHPQPGYPFSLSLSIEYALSPSGLTVRTTVTNVGTEACPFGSGAHPYLTLGTPTVDSVILRAPGRTVLHSDRRGVPIGAMPVEDTQFDFRDERRIGPTKLDNAFTNLERGEDGLARVELQNPEARTKLTLWVDESYEYLMLFTGDSRPDVNRRSLAVEPMTCPPNAFRTREALIRLEPDSSYTGAWGITP
jgi:aldose 1-epimerase